MRKHEAIVHMAWGSSLYTQRTGSIELNGFYLVESITGIRDQGQLTVEQAGTVVGYSAYRNFRIEMTPIISGVKGTSMGGFTFQGQAALNDMGGNTTDVMPWGATIVFQGKPTGSGVFNIF